MGLANSFAVSLIERPMAFNQDLKALIPLGDVSGAFLVYALLFAGRKMLQNVTDAAHGTKRLSQDDLRFFEVPVPSPPEQAAIAAVLDRLVDTIDTQRSALNKTKQLKASAMRELFVRGLRGEARTETEAGLVPHTWVVQRLDEWADVVSTRMSYSELERYQPTTNAEYLQVLGIKVSDMNLRGNETTISGATLAKSVDRVLAERRCAPPRTIVFPKRGAAIATNKKRLTNDWTVFDPNVIGVTARAQVVPEFLFHWFQAFDLRTITEPGPTPQLNKKNLTPILIAAPQSLEEQREISDLLDAFDEKAEVHKRRLELFERLLKSLLSQLMTGQVRVTDLNLSALEQTAAAPVSA
jgi:type I restriction enzyme S subunit